jgi:hypothetical protein
MRWVRRKELFIEPLWFIYVDPNMQAARVRNIKAGCSIPSFAFRVIKCGVFRFWIYPAATQCGGSPLSVADLPADPTLLLQISLPHRRPYYLIGAPAVRQCGASYAVRVTVYTEASTRNLTLLSSLCRYMVVKRHCCMPEILLQHA